MDEDIEGEGRLSAATRARRIRAWLARPRTLRIVAPAALVLAVALLVAGVLVLTSGGTGSRMSSLEEDATLIGATAFPVPPGMVDGISYAVPPRQPFTDFRIQIDSIDVDARVLDLGVDKYRVPQVPDNAAWAAWYNFTSRPAAGGNAVLAGHVRWGGERGVFADLKKLDNGDSVRVKWSDGREANYEVVANFAVNASDPDSLEVMAPTPTDTLTLITCGGRFVADSDNPRGGDFTERTVVRARLIRPAVVAIPY